MPRQRDYGLIAIVCLVGIVVVWLLLTPLVPAVVQSTIDRFHLRGDSFVLWAIQCPIPAMYNFANQAMVSEQPIDDFVADQTGNEPRFVNHFPARRITFADARARELRDGRDRWLTIQTTYRGQTIRSAFHVRSVNGPIDPAEVDAAEEMILPYRLRRLADPEPQQ